jgi:tetrahydromethanopterin S-methyltransferase subunit E
MTTLLLAVPQTPGKIAFLTKKEWRSMFNDRAVLITMIVCGTLLFLATIAGVVFLAYTGNDAAVIGVVVGSVLTGVMSLMNSRVKQTRDMMQSKE